MALNGDKVEERKDNQFKGSFIDFLNLNDMITSLNAWLDAHRGF